jgi:hypothetical protein
MLLLRALWGTSTCSAGLWALGQSLLQRTSTWARSLIGEICFNRDPEGARESSAGIFGFNRENLVLIGIIWF